MSVPDLSKIAGPNDPEVQKMMQAAKMKEMQKAQHQAMLNSEVVGMAKMLYAQMTAHAAFYGRFDGKALAGKTIPSLEHFLKTGKINATESLQISEFCKLQAPFMLSEYRMLKVDAVTGGDENPYEKLPEGDDDRIQKPETGQPKEGPNA